MKLKLLLFFVLVSLWACEKPKQNKEEKKYFDLKAWVAETVKQKSGKRCVLVKKTLIDGKSDKQALEQINWENELMLFAEADLNSPAMTDDYQITENTAEKTVVYRSTNPNNKVKKMEIKGYPDLLSEINIDVSEANQFYEATRKMRLKLVDNQLVGYQIIGVQRILFKDAMEYEINAKLE